MCLDKKLFCTRFGSLCKKNKFKINATSFFFNWSFLIAVCITQITLKRKNAKSIHNFNVLRQETVLYHSLFFISRRNGRKITFLKFPESSKCFFSLLALQQRITFIFSSNLKICWFVVIIACWSPERTVQWDTRPSRPAPFSLAPTRPSWRKSKVSSQLFGKRLSYSFILKVEQAKV
jgi:hypothetical protein